MNDMISRDRVIALLGLDHNDYVYIDKRELAKRVEKLKGMDIVRCKDCRWLDKGENESCSWSMCARHIGQYINVSDDDYCSYGERSRR